MTNSDIQNIKVSRRQTLK